MKVRVGGKQLSVRLDHAIVTTRPDGSQSVRITDMRDFQVLGETFRPYARELGARLLQIAGNPQRNDGKRVSIPVNLHNMVTWLLLALPTSRRGRPPKASTLQARRLLAEVGSKLGAARAAADKTGEPAENLRRRLRSKPKKTKKKGRT
jgi:hypothetical protein